MIIRSTAQDGLETILPSTEVKRNTYRPVRGYQVIPFTPLWENCTDLERSNGCVWSEMFRSVDTVGLNDGSVIGGAPVDDGVVLDGGSQSVTYSVGSTVFNDTKTSTTFEFYPDFDYDYVNTRFFYDTDGGNYSAYKLSSAGGDRLIVKCGGTVIANSAPATYGPHWKAGQRNVLVVSTTSGTNNVYLNGVNVSSTATAWTPAAASTFYIGISSANTSRFDGTISKVQIYDTLITAQGAAAMYNLGTFTNDGTMST